MDTDISKKRRQRKKQLYSSILQQMEFYFSDSNLSKDRFLAQLMNESLEVDLDVFLKFNKIRKITTNISDIQKAISKSELIELNEDNTKVRRKIPIKIKDNVDECTIYVEAIKPDADHDWLSSVFSEFGNVVYVSIPKYKQNKLNKGFAFVEFETSKEAASALDYFESIGCKMPSETNPEDLQSIITFEAETEKSENKNEDESNRGEKRKLDLTETDEGNKKLKSEEESEIDTDSNKKEDLETEEDSKKKKKSKKEHKKKNYIKELGLRVLSKKEWKKMRNRYLDLQKKKMKQYKQYLNRIKYGQKCFDKLKKTSDIEEIKIIEETKTTEEKNKLEFIPGVIVKVKLPEPCFDVKKLKNDIKTYSSDVKYVDIPLPAGSTEVYLRFGNNESAKEFCKQEYNGKLCLLENEEEKSYWEKIQNDRAVKFKKSIKKQRGRDKLIKRAEKEMAKSNHIRFEECE